MTDERGGDRATGDPARDDRKVTVGDAGREVWFLTFTACDVEVALCMREGGAAAMAPYIDSGRFKRNAVAR